MKSKPDVQSSGLTVLAEVKSSETFAVAARTIWSGWFCSNGVIG